MSNHAAYRFSITIWSDDRAAVYCLRAIAKFCQETGNNQIPWGGTTDDSWKKDGHRVTFRFSSPTYREGFVREATRLLPKDSWQESARSDQDPASSKSR
jgi:hypothetical protein